MQTDEPGTILAHKYELVELIGRGGMAVVWRAFALGPDRFRLPVAVKRIDPEYRGYPEVTAMFVEEARVGAALRHPNIVQVFDFGRDASGEHYLITELVEGPTVGEWVESHTRGARRTPWNIVAAIGVEVLRALEAAHERRDDAGAPAPIFHRDVTPPNILLDTRGMVKLLDFGLALAMDRHRVTRPNVIKGKLSYLAPELLLGAAPSAETDIFSLGVVLWEALAQRRLFDATSDVEVIELIRLARSPLINTLRSDLPLGLVSVVHRALERDPALRFASARDMLNDLTEVLRVVPESVDARTLARSFTQGRLEISGAGSGQVEPPRT